MGKSNCVAVIDFGSQTTKLIARRVRELGVYSQIVPAHVSAAHIMAHAPKAIIISGGPDFVGKEGAPSLDPDIFELGVPLLGICYGMQLICQHFGGSVSPALKREFGQREIAIGSSALFEGLNSPLSVWMSHGDQALVPEHAFVTIASSASCPHAAVACPPRNIFGVQFHPEVSHTPQGIKILANFLFNIANIQADYDLGDFLTTKIADIKAQVGEDRVIMGLSGGVDSSVAAVLIHRAIGEQLACVYVNHGLHRLGELEEISRLFKQVLAINLHVVDAREQFWQALAGVRDPEQKRKAIGHVFIDVFDQEASRHPQIKFLGQGTLYPDVIESAGKAIKSHHNVGGLPSNMKLKLLEPLRELFKDEVRLIGKLLGLSEEVVMRQPFPGPGLAVRIPGEVTPKKVALLQQADKIIQEEIKFAKLSGFYSTPMWQWFGILLPLKSVGVMGDARVYGYTIVIRCVDSTDAMTADWSKLPHELLGTMSSRITNEVAGISRVLYDITQKPPATIEWE